MFMKDIIPISILKEIRDRLDDVEMDRNLVLTPELMDLFIDCKNKNDFTDFRLLIEVS